MKKYEFCMNTCTALLVTSNVFGHLVAKKAPKLGYTVAATCYVAAGIVSVIGAYFVFTEDTK